MFKIVFEILSLFFIKLIRQFFVGNLIESVNAAMLTPQHKGIAVDPTFSDFFFYLLQNRRFPNKIKNTKSEEKT